MHRARRLLRLLRLGRIWCVVVPQCHSGRTGEQRWNVGSHGAVIDGDFHMTRRDRALEAIHQLQHYDLVQRFSSYSDLSSEHRPFRVMPSFAFNYMKGATSADYRKTLRAAAAPYAYYGGHVAKAGSKPAAWPVGAPGPSGGRPSTR